MGSLSKHCSRHPLEELLQSSYLPPPPPKHRACSFQHTKQICTELTCHTLGFQEMCRACTGSSRQSLCASSAHGDLTASPPAAALLAKDIVSERSVMEEYEVRFYFPTVNKISPGIKAEELAPLCIIQNHRLPVAHNLPELQTLLQLLENQDAFLQ